jgi:catechol 2,3-dioxygenase
MQNSTAQARIAARPGVFRISAGAKGGHATLPVAHLDESVEFYHHVLALSVLVHDSALILHGAEGVGGTESTPMPGGRHRLVIRYPHPVVLFEVVRRLAEHDYPIDSGLNHAGAISVYLRDPEGNELELYCEVPASGGAPEPDSRAGAAPASTARER